MGEATLALEPWRGLVIRPKAVALSHVLQPEQAPVPSYLAEAYAADTLLLALKVYETPEIYLQRLTKRITIFRSRHVQELVYELRFDDGPDAGSVVLLPISFGLRADIRDDINAISSSGWARRLTSDEERELASVLLRATLIRVFQSAGLESETQTPQFEHYRDQLARIPFSNRLYGTVTIRRTVEWLRTFDSIDGDSETVAALIRHCVFLVERNLVVVATQMPTQRTITITRTTDQALGGVAHHRLDGVRKLLGRRQYLFDIPVADVKNAGSFHLFLSSPDGHHIHSADVSPLRDRSDSSRGITTSPLSTNLYKKSGIGTDQLHVYFHPTTQAERRQLAASGVIVRAQVFEDLPGSQIPVFITALLLAVTILFININVRHVLPAPGAASSLASAFPAFFVTLPGVAALFFRPQDRTEVVNAPLTSALGPVVSALASLGVAIAYFAAFLRPTENHRVFLAFSWSSFVLVGGMAIYLGWRVWIKLRRELPDCNV